MACCANKRFPLLVAVLLIAWFLEPPWARNAAGTLAQSPRLPIDPETASIELVPVVDGLDQPLYVAHPRDGRDRLFVVERPGIISIVSDDEKHDRPFLDISERVLDSGFEQGLFSVAFHPDFERNGYFYVAYTSVPDGDNVLGRFQLSEADPPVADPNSELRIFDLPSPHEFHNGGDIAFGPHDGYLYYATGDGGSSPDTAQDPQSFFGKILRIDVDGGTPYAIPDDNPFVEDPRFLPEIWALGLRNPWRFSFDGDTGDLFIGDVGATDWEELNHQPASSSGGENYGWPIMEGTHCYPQGTNCDETGLTLPILDYSPFDEMGERVDCAIVAGAVYRGFRTPGMNGAFLFGDWCSGRISFAYRLSGGAWASKELAVTGLQITSIREDERGALYLTDMQGGVLYRVVLEAPFIVPDGEGGGRELEDFWARTDAPVSDGGVARSWIWGPEPRTDLMIEAYAGSASQSLAAGTRVVRYYDKGRLEITDPARVPDSPWFITSGLLVNELISSSIQVGDDRLAEWRPAHLNVAGDWDDPHAVTYASLASILMQPAAGPGTLIDTRLDWVDQRLGWITDSAYATYGVTAAHHVPESGHTVAAPFWELMNATGAVLEGDELVNAPLFPNPFYATGFPVTEANWTTIKVGSVYKDVLLQCFERRCLTYTPDNPEDWQVEATNTGQHYYQWRYGDAGQSAPAIMIDLRSAPLS